ncbi:Uncharacterized protein Fot_14499 [Forsythia ovata]|uniref:NADH dehydrogenase subunit 7 n=1 Tax=Forsythia ovata TaxID=205694 RepID=A0ABD1W6H5_9LAMI
MGPHHPSMHGVLRLIVTLDGEDVIDCEPILGNLHRGMEKITENRTIIQYLPYVTRWDYLATMFIEAITVDGPEQLGNIQTKIIDIHYASLQQLSEITIQLLPRTFSTGNTSKINDRFRALSNCYHFLANFLTNTHPLAHPIVTQSRAGIFNTKILSYVASIVETERNNCSRSIKKVNDCLKQLQSLYIKCYWLFKTIVLVMLVYTNILNVVGCFQ